MMKFNTIILLFISLPCLADQCPTVEQVRERNISRDYDWSVSEDVTLDMLLAVSELNKVELNNHGEFVACHYTSDGLPVRLDGAPPEPNCRISKLAGDWLPGKGGALDCTENEPDQCQFQIECYESGLDSQ